MFMSLLSCAVQGKEAPEPAVDWSDAHSFDLAYETEPGVNLPAAVATRGEFKVQDGVLWLRFQAEERDMALLRAHPRERDNIDGEDAVGIVLAPAGRTGGEAFAFYVSAGGVQMDEHWSEARREWNADWNGKWWSGVEREANGWRASFRIPLSQLPLTAETEPQWAVELVRWWPREVRHRLSSISRQPGESCFVCAMQSVPVRLGDDWDMGQIEGRLSLQGQRGDDGSGMGTSTRWHGGLDLNWRPRPGFNAALTWRPDFSQIESDSLRLSGGAIDAFDYDEKRAFFVDAGQPFTQLLRPFYSRAIGEPELALSGQLNLQRQSLAWFYADDKHTQMLQPGPFGSNNFAYRKMDGAEQASRNLAVRYRQVVNNDTWLGLTLTGREAGDYSNRLLGMDGKAGLGRSLWVDGSVLASRSEEPWRDAQSHAGRAWHARLGYSTDDWDNKLWWQRITPDFRADLGYMPRVDMQQQGMAFKRIFRQQPGAAINEYDAGLDWSRRRTLEDEPIERNAQLWLSMSGIGQSNATVWLMDKRRRFQGQDYSLSGVEWVAAAAPSEHWSLSGGAVFSGDIDRENARQGRQQRWKFDLSVAPWQSVRLEWQRNWRELHVAGSRVSRETANDARGYYFWGPRLYLRAIVRWWQLERSLPRYETPGGFNASERSRDWQVMLTWLPTPRSSLYLGVGQGLDGVQAGMGGTESAVRSHVLFAKFNLGFDRLGVF
ncbi:DUF5916 domain-containing protein [Chromobacterium phragmitis]|uniref:DUF5916 domain-containing protein n=1 Tax=Chromobacterium phragmitis TaxID=2202141 RepID=A0ABV0IXB8_9NEIS